jgi:ubiquinone/menaquinone biosynthesis C-methylase UbiE
MLKPLRNTFASFFVLFMVLSLNVAPLHCQSDSKATTTEKDSKTPSTEKDSKATPIEKDSKVTPIEKDSKAPAIEKDSKTPPVEKDSKTAPIEKDSKVTPVEKDSKAPPVEKDSKPTPTETKKPAPSSKDRLPNLYSYHHLRLMQISFGTEGIISQGGLPSVDYLFKGINLDGKKILDVGCGFGGVDIHLAQQFSCYITAIDCEPYMILQAEKFREKEVSFFLGQVEFQVSKELTALQEFPSQSFDVVCSKEMLYHVPKEQKQQYLNEMYRVLKPGGILVIADWLQGTPLLGEHLKRTMGVEGFSHYVTSKELLQIMIADTDFKKVIFEDVTYHHIQYTLEDIDRIRWAAHQIDQELGEGSSSRAIKSWNLWLTALQTHELAAAIFIGYKAD